MYHRGAGAALNSAAMMPAHRPFEKARAPRGLNQNAMGHLRRISGLSAIWAAAAMAAFASFPAAAQDTAPAPAAAPAAAAAETRSEFERKLDGLRRPNEVLAFFGLKAGDVAGEYLAGGGYYAKIMAGIVGPKGSVIAFNPPSFLQSEGALKNWAELTARPDNISLQLRGNSDFAAADNSFDFMMMHLVYHDVYFESAQFGMLRADPDVFLAKLYKAMKPGGIVAIVDHVGPAGDTRAIVDATHRIDPATVKADFARAGFRLAAESDMLAKPDDDISKSVFDPSIRGETNRFMLKYVKPQ